MFHEKYIWTLIYRLTEILSPLHMVGLPQGPVHPTNVFFCSGRIEIRGYREPKIDPFFVPQERQQSPFSDIFTLGRTMSFVIAGYEDCYSRQLVQLIQWMQNDVTNHRPTVRAIMTFVYDTLLKENVSEMLETQSSYGRLYQNYTIELYQYQERVKNEKILLDKKFRRLLEMENDFMYFAPLNK